MIELKKLADMEKMDVEEYIDEDSNKLVRASVLSILCILMSIVLLIVSFFADKYMDSMKWVYVGWGVLIFINTVIALMELKLKKRVGRNYERKEAEKVERINRMREIIASMQGEKYKVGKIKATNIDDIAWENVYISDDEKGVSLIAYIEHDNRIEEIGGLFKVAIDRSLVEPVFEAVYISPEYEVRRKINSGYYNGVLTVPSMDVIN